MSELIPQEKPGSSEPQTEDPKKSQDTVSLPSPRDTMTITSTQELPSFPRSKSQDSKISQNTVIFSPTQAATTTTTTTTTPSSQEKPSLSRSSTLVSEKSQDTVLFSPLPATMITSPPSQESSLPKPQQQEKQKALDTVELSPHLATLTAPTPLKPPILQSQETQNGKESPNTTGSSTSTSTTPSPGTTISLGTTPTSTQSRPSLLNLSPASKNSKKSMNPDFLCCCQLGLCRTTHCGSSSSSSTTNIHPTASDKTKLCPYYAPKLSPKIAKKQLDLEKQIDRRMDLLVAKNKKLDTLDYIAIKKIQEAKKCKKVSSTMEVFLPILMKPQGKEIRLIGNGKVYIKTIARRISTIKLSQPIKNLKKEKDEICDDCKAKSIRYKVITKWTPQDIKGKKVEMRKRVDNDDDDDCMKKTIWNCSFTEEVKRECEIKDHKDLDCFCVDNRTFWEKGEGRKMLDFREMGYQFYVGKHSFSCRYYRLCSVSKVQDVIEERRKRWANLLMESPTTLLLGLIDNELMGMI